MQLNRIIAITVNKISVGIVITRLTYVNVFLSLQNKMILQANKSNSKICKINLQTKIKSKSKTLIKNSC
jgi:hypothetical protein